MKQLFRFWTGFSWGFIPVVAVAFFFATFAPSWDARQPYYRVGPIVAAVTGMIIGAVFVIRKVKV